MGDLKTKISTRNGDVCLRKNRRKRQKFLLQELFFDYANNTTLHGLPYITNRRLTAIEKIFWLITFIISVCFCCYYISSVWLKWKNSPVIVTISERLVSVTEVPFPSVTICPQVKSHISMYNISEEHDKLLELMYLHNESTAEDFGPSIGRDVAKFEDVALICNQDHDIPFDFTSFHPRNSSNSSVLTNILDVFNTSYWNSDIYCGISGPQQWHKAYFKEVFTSQGVCFNINSLSASKIYRKPSLPVFEERNQDVKEPKLYPTEFSLIPDINCLLLEPVDEQDDCCNTLYSGYKIYVQHPHDVPQASVHSYSLQNDQSMSMALSFKMMKTSKSLEHYDPQIRQCYLPDERYLQHFQIYTSSNCRIECLANITLRECGCVEFYMPRTRDTPICTWQNECRKKAAHYLLEQESHPETSICQCLPSCDSIEYDAEILKRNYNSSKYQRHIKIRYQVFDTYMPSKLQIYYKRPHFTSMRRSEMFGMIDFLANCGGLLGLFLGFSVLSLVEAVYFITFRLWYALNKDLDEEKDQNIQEVKID